MAPDIAAAERAFGEFHLNGGRYEDTQVHKRQLSIPQIKAAQKTNPVVGGGDSRLSTYASEAFDQDALAREETYPFDEFKPSFPKVRHEPLVEEATPADRGLFADPTMKGLLSKTQGTYDITVNIGTELKGLDLRTLTDSDKDELALLIAERGVVFIKDQHDWTIEDQLALGRHWGKLHKHATTGVPKRGDLDEVHVVYSDDKKRAYSGPALLSRQDLFHSDVTYELQPPSYTSFKVLHNPPTGGDTLWVSGYSAYDRLSFPMREYLEKLTAVHSASEQAEGCRRAGNTVRRDPIETEHPIVRTHPVTGWKALFVNPGFTRYIVGVPKAESDHILRFLFDLISTSTDFQVRWKWSNGDVAIWDNRTNIHSATYDFGAYGARRHAVRVAPHGETPVLEETGRSREICLLEKSGVPIEIDLKQARAVGYKD